MDVPSSDKLQLYTKIPVITGGIVNGSLLKNYRIGMGVTHSGFSFIGLDALHFLRPQQFPAIRVQTHQVIGGKGDQDFSFRKVNYPGWMVARTFTKTRDCSRSDHP